MVVERRIHQEATRLLPARSVQRGRHVLLPAYEDHDPLVLIHGQALGAWGGKEGKGRTGVHTDTDSG